MALVVVYGILLSASAAEPSPAVAVRAATPASRPARAREVPGELIRACSRRAEALRGRLGPECRFYLAPPFVVAGDLPADRLARYCRELIRHAAEAMWRTYFVKRPTDAITVLLFGSAGRYRAYAKRLYGDERVAYYGYYRPDERTLLMNISTGGGTLVHELTHALIAYDFPNVPAWFNEGLGSLHEQCNQRAWERGKLVGDVNWRLAELHGAIAAGRLRRLRDLVTRDDFRGRQESLNYAHARYLCMYMQQRGVLAEFYREFRDGYKDDRTGLSYLEDVLGGRRIETVEREFLDWVGRLECPP